MFTDCRTPKSLVILAFLAAVVWAGFGLDERTGSLVANSFYLAAGTCLIAIPVGTGLALLLAKTNVPGRRAAVVTLVVMLFVPLYLQAGAWQAGFGLQGWYTLAFGGPTLLETWRAAIWIHAAAAVPWVTLIVGASLLTIEPELEEEALLVATPVAVFLRVTLRRAAAAMLIAALWVAVMTVGEMTVTDLFQIRTFAEEIYTRYNLGIWDKEPPLLLTGTLLTGILLLAAAAASLQLSPQMGTVSLARRRQWNLGRWRAVAGLGLWSNLGLLAGVPLGNLAFRAGVLVTQTDEGRERSWSLAKCASMILTSPATHAPEFRWSFEMAATAATAALVVGAGLAWLATHSRAGSLLALLITAAAIATPGPVLGVGLIRLLYRPDVLGLAYLYDYTIFAPCVAQTIKALPLVLLLLWHAFSTIPSEMLDSAATEGAGPLTRMAKITIPNRLPALILAWLVAFVVSIGELAATILVVPPGLPTLPVRIFGLLHYGVEDQVAGICLALVGMQVLIATVFLRLPFGRNQ